MEYRTEYETVDGKTRRKESADKPENRDKTAGVKNEHKEGEPK